MLNVDATSLQRLMLSENQMDRGREFPLKSILPPPRQKVEEEEKLYLETRIRSLCRRSEFLVATHYTGCKGRGRWTGASLTRCSSLLPTLPCCSTPCCPRCSWDAQTAQSLMWRRRRGGTGGGPCCSSAEGPATTPGAGAPSITVLMLHQHKLSSSNRPGNPPATSLHSIFPNPHCVVKVTVQEKTLHILKPSQNALLFGTEEGAEAKISGSMAWRHCQREMRPIQSLFGAIVGRNSRS